MRHTSAAAAVGGGASRSAQGCNSLVVKSQKAQPEALPSISQLIPPAALLPFWAPPGADTDHTGHTSLTGFARACKRFPFSKAELSRAPWYHDLPSRILLGERGD